MPAFLHPLRRRPTGWLALAVLAMVLHLLAGSGWLRPAAAAGSSDRFVAELCTTHGLIAAEAPSVPADRPHPAGASHDCCKLCAAGGSLLVAGFAVAVAPAPTFAALFDPGIYLRSSPAPWTAHAPRGPPAPA
ncbi:MAG: hypothetical protein Q8J99_18365 [Sulfuritalea sp.]|nr:hypothetical protein [Sulfuritalea sp.]